MSVVSMPSMMSAITGAWSGKVAGVVNVSGVMGVDGTTGVVMACDPVVGPGSGGQSTRATTVAKCWSIESSGLATGRLSC
jgi:hypothetical protein